MDTTVLLIFDLAILALVCVQTYLALDEQYAVASSVMVVVWVLWLVTSYLGSIPFALLVVYTVFQAVILIVSVTLLVIKGRRRNDGSD